MAYQVLPWYQFESDAWHRGEFPLWDPNVWGGQPLLGQIQPGAAYPPNWLLFLSPLREGHIQRMWLNVYFILTHFFAALFCYWFCRDLGRTASASLFGGFAFALGGVVGSIAWPQMLNGAVWIPLVLLFYLRSVRGYNRLTSAALAGTFLGISFLSGHHQIPTFTALMMLVLWLVELSRRRVRALSSVAMFVTFAALVSAFQTIPAYEYGTRSIRWVGSQNPIFWGQSVPYTVHQQYSLPPLELLSLAVSGSTRDTFMGVTVVVMALIGFTLTFNQGVVRLMGGICIGSLLFAMGGFSVFHGIFYLLVPLVEKARTPAMAIVLAQFTLAVMASYGIDALRLRPPPRWCFTALLTIGLLPWPVLAGFSAIRDETSREYERFAVAALASLAVAAVLRGWKRAVISESAAITLLCVTALFEFGTVTGQSYRHRETPGGFLKVLDQDRDVVDFLRKQTDFVRLEVDTDALPYNVGDWDGIEQFRAYLGGMTSNLIPFEIERQKGGHVASELFGLNYAVGRKVSRAGQIEVFNGASGLNVYRNPEAFPPVWSVHRRRAFLGQDPISELQSADLRREVFLTGTGPALDQCDNSDGDIVRLLKREQTHITIEAVMTCKGMVVLSQTFFPGWQATVDGKPVRVEEADGTLQGVVTPAGTHRIEFKYRPQTVYWGGLLSAVGLGAALMLALLTRRSRPFKHAESADNQAVSA